MVWAFCRSRVPERLPSSLAPVAYWLAGGAQLSGPARSARDRDPPVALRDKCRAAALSRWGKSRSCI